MYVRVYVRVKVPFIPCVYACLWETWDRGHYFLSLLLSAI